MNAQGSARVDLEVRNGFLHRAESSQDIAKAAAETVAAALQEVLASKSGLSMANAVAEAARGAYEAAEGMGEAAVEEVRAALAADISIPTAEIEAYSGRLLKGLKRDRSKDRLRLGLWTHDR